MANVKFTDEEIVLLYAGQAMFLPLERGGVIRARKIGHRVVLDISERNDYTKRTREGGAKGRPLASP